MRIVRLLLTLVTTSYVLGLVGFLLFQQAAPDAHWSIALLREFLVFVFVPVPVLAALALAARHQAALVLLAVPTIAFLALFGSLFVPRLVLPATASGKQILVRSHNAEVGSGDLEAEIARIRVRLPDIPAVQALTRAVADRLASPLHPRHDYDGYG